jgi:acetylglutamate kinase
MSWEDVDAMTAAGTAHSGMVAKLAACRFAAAHGVGNVTIVDGRSAGDYAAARGTRVMAASSVEGLH